MRLLVALIALIVFATASGSRDRAASPSETQANVGGPSAPPPELLDIQGPPPAWIGTESAKFWLAYATFCWPGCADYRAPVCGDERRAPTIVVRRAEVVRFYLGFEPRSHVSLRFFAHGKDVRTIRLAVERRPTWKVERGGAFWIDAAQRGGGSASYAGCFDVASRNTRADRSTRCAGGPGTSKPRDNSHVTPRSQPPSCTYTWTRPT